MSRSIIYKIMGKCVWKLRDKAVPASLLTRVKVKWIWTEQPTVGWLLSVSDVGLMIFEFEITSHGANDAKGWRGIGRLHGAKSLVIAIARILNCKSG